MFWKGNEYFTTNIIYFSEQSVNGFAVVIPAKLQYMMDTVINQ